MSSSKNQTKKMAAETKNQITRRAAVGSALTMSALMVGGSFGPAEAQNVHANRKKVQRYMEGKAEREANEPSKSWIESILPGSNSNTGAGQPPASATPLQISARNCLSQGDIARKYCLDRINAGDKSVEPCLRTVEAMLPVCNALAKLEELHANRLNDMAKVTMLFLSDCHKQCQKLGQIHTQLSGCAFACAACLQECRNTLKA